MGLWGYGLYQNDTSLDVKDEFEELFNTGKTAQEITDKLVEDYTCIMDDVNEEPQFWFALADTQWNYGVLLPNVQKKAIYWIDKDSSFVNFETLGTSVAAKRRVILAHLRIKLLSPQPNPRKSIKRRVYKCQWQLGDVFAYRLESDYAKEKGLYKRYLLIQKVDEDKWHPGHIVPIVYIKITNDTNLPSNIEEYNQLKYVQICFSKYEDRFWPIDMRNPKEDIAEKSIINYQVDEYGFLPQYRIMLLNTSKKIIPSKLIYLGNFTHSTAPKIEFIPHLKINISAVSWGKQGENFETEIINRYCWHNLRELSIYSTGGQA